MPDQSRPWPNERDELEVEVEETLEPIDTSACGSPGVRERMASAAQSGRETLASGKARLSETASRAQFRAREGLASGKARLSETASRVQAGTRQGLESILDTIQEGSVRGSGMLRRQIECRPMLSLGVGFATGTAIGFLIRRLVRRSRSC